MKKIELTDIVANVDQKINSELIMIEYITNPAVLTLFGVLMGSGLSLIGSILTQYLSNRKDAQQWDREQAAKNHERDLEREIKKDEELEALYHQCIGCLSVYIATIHPNSKVTNADLSSLTKDVHNSLSKLVVKHPDEILLRALDNFLSYPDAGEANRIRKYILEIIKKDYRPENSVDVNDNAPVTISEAQRVITFPIDKEFQKSLMTQGVELPNNFKLKYETQDLLPKYREKLLEIYFPSHRKIPDQAALMLPTKQGRATVVTYTKIWEAKVNPFDVGLNGVLDEWAADFERSSQEAQASMASAT